jgi:hypothetical protein
MADTDTSLALTGVYSGLKIDAAASSGTLAASAAVTARTGYRIAKAVDNEGNSYIIVTVDDEKDVLDPPTLVFASDYAQQIEIAEVDLDIRYTDVPQGTALQVACSETGFDISRQTISGTGLVGSSGKDLGAFSTSIEVRLWLPPAAALKPSSALTLNISKIQGGVGKPVKKVLLQKLAINLSN